MVIPYRVFVIAGFLFAFGADIYRASCYVIGIAWAHWLADHILGAG